MITYHLPLSSHWRAGARNSPSICHLPAARRPHHRPCHLPPGYTVSCHALTLTLTIPAAPLPSILTSTFLTPTPLSAPPRSIVCPQPYVRCVRGLARCAHRRAVQALLPELPQLPQDDHLLYLALIEVALLWMMLLTTSCLVFGVRLLVITVLAARKESAAELALNMPPNLSRAEKHLWRVFRQADTDKNGSVDLSEFRKLLLEGHYDFTPEELDR